MFDEKTLTESQEGEKRWRAAFDQMQERMKSDGGTPQSHSGLPIKNAYFPHDIEHPRIQPDRNPRLLSFYSGKSGSAGRRPDRLHPEERPRVKGRVDAMTLRTFSEE